MRAADGSAADRSAAAADTKRVKKWEACFPCFYAAALTRGVGGGAQQQQQRKSATATTAAARARGNEINTDRRSNALLTCQFPVF
jgi:hypothetical protein